MCTRICLVRWCSLPPTHSATEVSPAQAYVRLFVGSRSSGEQRCCALVGHCGFYVCGLLREDGLAGQSSRDDVGGLSSPKLVRSFVRAQCRRHHAALRVDLLASSSFAWRSTFTVSKELDSCGRDSIELTTNRQPDRTIQQRGNASPTDSRRRERVRYRGFALLKIAINRVCLGLIGVFVTDATATITIVATATRTPPPPPITQTLVYKIFVQHCVDTNQMKTARRLGLLRTKKWTYKILDNRINVRNRNRFLNDITQPFPAPPLPRLIRLHRTQRPRRGLQRRLRRL